MNQELKQIADKYNIHFYAMWGIEGGNGWIWYKQDDESRYKVQIFTNANFDVYNSIKSDVVNLFLLRNCSLSNEQNLDKSFGYRRNLFFMGTEELQTQIKEKEKSLQSPIYNIGQIYADGGIVTLGNVINSTQNIDNSIHQIENLIEEKGGEDKEELYSTLKDAKEIINEILKTKEIKPKKGFMDKLSNHLTKHGWFYGAIATLLGTALLAALGLSN